MKNAGSEAMVTEYGLLLDHRHETLLDSDKVEGARDRAAMSELCSGTVDSLIWRLTGGRMHVTDATNASRTSIYNIHQNDWMTNCWPCSTCPAQACLR